MLLIFCLIFTLITGVCLTIFGINYIIDNFVTIMIGLPFVIISIFVLLSSMGETAKLVVISILLLIGAILQMAYEEGVIGKRW